MKILNYAPVTYWINPSKVISFLTIVISFFNNNFKEVKFWRNNRFKINLNWMQKRSLFRNYFSGGRFQKIPHYSTAKEKILRRISKFFFTSYSLYNFERRGLLEKNVSSQ